MPHKLGAVSLLVTAALLPGCGCDDVPLTETESALAVDRPRIDFGRVFVGGTARETLILSAPGERPVQYSTSLAGDVFDYQVGPAVGTIGPNLGVEVVVVFRPLAAGSATGQIVFAGNATRNATVTVDLIALGVDPPDCEDGNGCTQDSFDLITGRCIHEAARLACDDFNACTVSDVCVEGICLGESARCDDGDVCTDDLCDPLVGCVNLPTSTCDDGNPCTRDICDPTRECRHEVLDDGTPCDDFEQCTSADICLAGRCIGVNVEDGFKCDDGDPCSFNDQCVSGICEDPDYEPARVGDIKFETTIAGLARDARLNPIVDRDSTVYVGLTDGVAAVDRCGALLWSRRELPQVRFSAAVALPGTIIVPSGSRVVDLDNRDGGELRRLDLAELFAPVQTASTATVSVRILDLASRASGGLVASVYREISDPPMREGLIAEIDRPHTTATVFIRLGTSHARRIALDADEALVAILRDGPPRDETAGSERIVRFGVEGLPQTSWSSSDVSGVHTDLALGRDGEVLWSAGLVSFSRAGVALPLLPTPLDPLCLDAGSPVTDSRIIYAVVTDHAGSSLGFRVAPDAVDRLYAFTASTGETRLNLELPGATSRNSPAVDAAGNIYILLETGELAALRPSGEPLFVRSLPISSGDINGVSLTLTPDRVAIVVTGGRVIGVQTAASLGVSSWPRHRRDNLSTGHR